MARKRKTHCPAGHEYSPANTYWQTNRHGNLGQTCRECAKLRVQRKREDPERKRKDRERTAKWRNKDPERTNALWREGRRVKKEWIDSQKVKCGRCSETHIACLEFHYKDPSEKEFTLSVAVAKHSLERIKAEVAKCEVICSNCHRKHHWQEKQQRSLAA